MVHGTVERIARIPIPARVLPHVAIVRIQPQVVRRIPRMLERLRHVAMVNGALKAVVQIHIPARVLRSVVIVRIQQQAVQRIHQHMLGF